MKTIKSILMMTALLLAIFATFPTITRSAPEPVVKAEYDIPAPPVNPVTRFNISVHVQDVSELHDWEFYLRWDPHIIRFIKIYEGPFVKAAAGPHGTEFAIKVGALGEYLQAYCGIWDTGYCANGSGTLATITFECYDSGDSFNFTLYDTSLWKEGLVPILHTTVKDLLWSTEFPVVKFDFTPAKPDVGQLVTFNASLSYAQPGRTIANFTWDFGDGNITSSGTNPVITHTYAGFGTFAVKCNVTDNVNNSWYTTKTLKIWRDVAAIDIWPCPWWHLYILGYEPYMETPVMHGDWLFKGEHLYITIAWQNLGTLTQNYKIEGFFQDVATGTRYAITGYGHGKLYGALTLPFNLTFGPDARSRICFLMDTRGGWDGTAVTAPGNCDYTCILKVTAPLDQDTGNDEYEYTIPFRLRIMGDANDDGIADGGDLGLLGLYWYATQDPIPPYPTEYCNFTREYGDDIVDGGDLGVLGLHWYETS